MTGEPIHVCRNCHRFIWQHVQGDGTVILAPCLSRGIHALSARRGCAPGFTGVECAEPMTEDELAAYMALS